MGRDACLQCLFCLPSKVHSKSALSPGSLQRAPTKRRSTSKALFSHLSKVPSRRAHLAHRCLMRCQVEHIHTRPIEPSIPASQRPHTRWNWRSWTMPAVNDIKTMIWLWQRSVLTWGDQ
jgi:hypothetical protein